MHTITYLESTAEHRAELQLVFQRLDHIPVTEGSPRIRVLARTGQMLPAFVLDHKRLTTDEVDRAVNMLIVKYKITHTEAVNELLSGILIDSTGAKVDQP